MTAAIRWNECRPLCMIMLAAGAVLLSLFGLLYAGHSPTGLWGWFLFGAAFGAFTTILNIPPSRLYLEVEAAAYQLYGTAVGVGVFMWLLPPQQKFFSVAVALVGTSLAAALVNSIVTEWEKCKDGVKDSVFRPLPLVVKDRIPHWMLNKEGTKLNPLGITIFVLEYIPYFYDALASEVVSIPFGFLSWRPSKGQNTV